MGIPIFSETKLHKGLTISEGSSEPIDFISKKQQWLSSSKINLDSSSNFAITNLFDFFVNEEINIDISFNNLFLSSTFIEVEILIYGIIHDAKYSFIMSTCKWLVLFLKTLFEDNYATSYELIPFAYGLKSALFDLVFLPLLKSFILFKHLINNLTFFIHLSSFFFFLIENL